jgi:hypothetical protein
MIGAVIVEVCADGAFFCRHLHGDDDGSFFDLTTHVANGGVTHDHRVEAINYGDVHHEKIDEVVAIATWGIDGKSSFIDQHDSLLDTLRPHHQFFHDLSDFAPRNHHNISDPHFIFKTHNKRTNNVEAALAGCAKFLEATRRDWCQSVVVGSNHDEALTKWLKSPVYDYRRDPENAVFYLETQLAYYKWLATDEGEPPVFENVLKDRADIDDVMFVGSEDTYIIAGGVECAMHGHLGVNGSRGSPKQFTRMGPKSNTGHTHSPEITDGAYVAGVSGKLDQGYNRGPSSWSQAHILTYVDGKRTILTMSKNRFYA